MKIKTAIGCVNAAVMCASATNAKFRHSTSSTRSDMSQRQNACLTCQHARFKGTITPGVVYCMESQEQHPVMHLCDSFKHISDRSQLAPFDDLQSCSASTTATNCPSGQKQAVF